VRGGVARRKNISVIFSKVFSSSYDSGATERSKIKPATVNLYIAKL
jgi:hypothetical protein